MRPIALALIALFAAAGVAQADACHDRFTELLVNGNVDIGPARIHITQEIVGGMTSVNYHYSDGKGNGYSEMIEPETLPWSLFIDGKMYMSTDKGKNWKFVNSHDTGKANAEMKAKMTGDAESATGIACGEETIDGTAYETVEGSYVSSTIAGATIFQKYWTNPQTGLIVRNYSHTKTGGFESKTTQIIEKYSDFKLPEVE